MKIRLPITLLGAIALAAFTIASVFPAAAIIGYVSLGLALIGLGKIALILAIVYWMDKSEVRGEFIKESE